MSSFTGQEAYGFVSRNNGKPKMYVPTTSKEPNVLAGRFLSLGLHPNYLTWSPLLVTLFIFVYHWSGWEMQWRLRTNQISSEKDLMWKDLMWLVKRPISGKNIIIGLVYMHPNCTVLSCPINAHERHEMRKGGCSFVRNCVQIACRTS